MNLQDTQEAVSEHLDTIRSYFKSGAKITILVRFEDDPEGRKDFMMSDDVTQEVIAMITRRAAEGKSR